MTKTPLVSILIPVYNRENFIEECVFSAISQDYPDIEIIIIDNASSDGTWGKCQKISAENRNVYVFQNSKNIGPVGNWAECAKKARGYYGKILFSDDMLLPGCITKMVSEFRNNNEVNVVSSATLIGNNLTEGVLKYSVSGSLITRKEYIESLIMNRLPVSPGAMMFKMGDLQKNIISTPPSYCEADFAGHGAGSDLLLILLSIGAKGLMRSIHEPLNFFRSHQGSFTEGIRKREVHDAYRNVLVRFLDEEFCDSSSARYLMVEYLKDVYRQYPRLPIDEFFSKYYGSNYVSRNSRYFLFQMVVAFMNLRPHRLILPRGE
ncbi:glycosyltransferase [Pseudomonadales bacterium]|nr:glycosyltransferase [Pseudomonadales bacterium]